MIVNSIHMPIPEFEGEPHQYWLPPGIHSCTRAEVEARFVYNAQRRKVWEYLVVFLNRLHDAGGTLEHVILDGSFVTGRAEPGDVDGCCMILPDDLQRMLDNASDNALLFFLTETETAKRVFGVHMFVCGDQGSYDWFCEYFRRGEAGTGLRDADPIRDPAGLSKPTEKGILRVDYRDFINGGVA